MRMPAPSQATPDRTSAPGGRHSDGIAIETFAGLVAARSAGDHRLAKKCRRELYALGWSVAERLPKARAQRFNTN